jgi:hypothetical protein
MLAEPCADLGVEVGHCLEALDLPTTNIRSAACRKTSSPAIHLCNICMLMNPALQLQHVRVVFAVCVHWWTLLHVSARC